MLPELITLIAMLVATVCIFINQSNKFNELNDKIDNNHKELSREITNIRIQVNRIEHRVGLPYSNGVLYNDDLILYLNRNILLLNNFFKKLFFIIFVILIDDIF